MQGSLRRFRLFRQHATVFLDPFAEAPAQVFDGHFGKIETGHARAANGGTSHGGRRVHDKNDNHDTSRSLL